MDFQAITKKWQDKWHADQTYEAKPDDRPKFFCSFPYPYINAYQHVGHLYTLMRVDALARYKRLTGHNVLFAQGWHITGSPIVNAAKRIKENEPKQMKIMRDMGFNEEQIKEFEDPKHWLNFFAPEFKKDYDRMGMSIDWRRTFHTSDLNPFYDKFIRWQFRKLKELGYCIKGRYPVVWDPKDNCPVGDHDRVEGEGETPKDFIWIKFRMQDSDLILMAGTTRPDALYGQSNLWIDPEGDYVVCDVKGEKWVVGRECVDKIKQQFTEPKILNSISPKEIIGKWVQGPLVDRKLYCLPAYFIDSSVGSGVVYSALEDPVDLFELKKIQSDEKLRIEFNLDEETTMALKPISIITVEGMGDNLGEDIGKEFKITSADQTKQLEEAKGELNRRVFRKGIMKENCGDCKGMTVPQCQEFLKEHLPKNADAVMFYELTGKVVSRSLTECIVKIVDDQWFLDYKNPEWKKLAHKCLDQMQLFPEKSRVQFDYVIDWLHAWACTREEGLGTKLPWDEQWLIESLSDSTIYMAFYTFNHILKEIPIEDVNDEFFDTLLQDKESYTKHPELMKQMKEEFNYWYPHDFRNSGKDLIQNHLTFYIFNHVALFPEDKWPKGIGANGWVTVDGQKMSKSLGNMIPVRNIAQEFGVDASRMTILSGGEGIDDANWDSELAKTLNKKFEQLFSFKDEYYNKGREDQQPIDIWMEGQIHNVIKTTTEHMELTNFRSALQAAYFEIQRITKWYLRRTANNPNKNTINFTIESQTALLNPIIPHITYELWEQLSKSNPQVNTNLEWPTYNQDKITSNAGEEIIKNLITDIAKVKELTKITQPKTITIFTPAQWKYDYLKAVKENISNPKTIIPTLMKNPDFKPYGQQIAKLTPNIVKNRKFPEEITSSTYETDYLQNSLDFLQKEFQAEINIIQEQSTQEQKAKNAMPGKPAILVE